MEFSGHSRGVNLGSLLTSGKFSDLKLVCEGREFAVHRAILCAQSRVISAQCEGNFEESRTNTIEVEEFEADTVQRMLEFLYSGNYIVPSHPDSSSHDAKRAEDAGLQGKPKPQSTSNEVESHGISDARDTQPFEDDKPLEGDTAISTKDILCCHLKADAIGDYYDIQPLCSHSRSKLQSAVEENWSADDFLHLLTVTCTTRKTGDADFHRLLGHLMAGHLEEVIGMQNLEDLDMPPAIAINALVTCAERMRIMTSRRPKKAVAW